MNRYQRMITYLYRYDENVKTDNVGFARIELRGEMLRVTVKLQDRLREMPDICFFVQSDQELRLIPATKAIPTHQNLSARIDTSAKQVMDTGYSFQMLDGIFIPVSDSLFYATTWKELQIRTDLVKTANMIRPSEMPANDPADHPAAVPTDAKPSEPKNSDRKSISNKKNNDNHETFPSLDSNVIDNRSFSSATSMHQEDKTDLVKQDYTEPQDKELKPMTTDFAEKLLFMFPKMYPFEIENIEECVRLDLKDIGYLPVTYWSLAGNPFLLHGYYCYRHLIFTKLPAHDYVIGVPGIYNETNQQHAADCGFIDFQPLVHVTNQQNAFGYWLYPIHSEKEPASPIH